MDGLTLITIVFFVLFALRVPIAITLIGASLVGLMFAPSRGVSAARRRRTSATSRCTSLRRKIRSGSWSAIRHSR
jgi:hypothetical protein